MRFVRQAIIAAVGVAAFGPLGGAACGGHLDATGAGSIVTSDGGATDVGSGGSGRPSSSSDASSGTDVVDACGPSCGISGAEAGVTDSAVPDGASTYPPVDGGSLIGDSDAAVGSVDGGRPSDSDGSTGCAYAPVSFSADIMPIFRLTGCALSSVCHGQMGNSGEENLYLGLNQGYGASTDSYAVYTGLVGVASEEDPSMNLITAGDPSSSYLWHKVVGDQNSNASVASGCAKATTMCSTCNFMTPCGTFMPYYGQMLSESAPDDLCTLQNWILEGALDN